MKRILVAFCALLCASAFGTTLNPIQLLNPSGSSSGQAIISTGSSSAPAWGGVGVNGIAAIAANTVLANVTGSNASPTAFAMPSCSAANSALKYTSATGWTCGTTFALTTGTLAQFAATTSAQFQTVLSDGTGSGVVVYNNAPAITSPVISGTPTAPTATAGTNTTQIATTAFVQAALPAGLTAYTPTIAAASGAYTTASATGAYSKTGKLVCFWATATITTVGTGTATILGLPFATASTNGGGLVFAGRENSVSGKMLQGFNAPGNSTMTITDYSNGSAAATGASEVMSGCYIST